jgi:hypothetical protein
LETLFVIAMMGVCVAIFLALVEGVVSVCSQPRPIARFPDMKPSMVLIPIEERRAQRLRFVGVERRHSHLAAVPRTDEQRSA